MVSAHSQCHIKPMANSSACSDDVEDHQAGHKVSRRTLRSAALREDDHRQKCTHHRRKHSSRHRRHSSRKKELVVANLQLRLAVFGQQSDDECDGDDVLEQPGVEMVPDSLACVPGGLVPGATLLPSAAVDGDAVGAPVATRQEQRSQTSLERVQAPAPYSDPWQAVLHGAEEMVPDSLPGLAKAAAETAQTGQCDGVQPRQAHQQQQPHLHHTSQEMVPDSLPEQIMRLVQAADDAEPTDGLVAGDSVCPKQLWPVPGLVVSQQQQQPQTDKHQSINMDAVAAAKAGTSTDYPWQHLSLCVEAMGANSSIRQSGSWPAGPAAAPDTTPLQDSRGGDVAATSNCRPATTVAAQTGGTAVMGTGLRSVRSSCRQEVPRPSFAAAGSATHIEAFGITDRSEYADLTALVRSARKRALSSLHEPATTAFPVVLQPTPITAGAAAASTNPTAYHADDSASGYDELAQLLRSARKRIHFTPSKEVTAIGQDAAAASRAAAVTTAAPGPSPRSGGQLGTPAKQNRFRSAASGLDLVPTKQQQQQAAGHAACAGAVSGSHHINMPVRAKRQLDLKPSSRGMLQPQHQPPHAPLPAQQQQQVRSPLAGLGQPVQQELQQQCTRWREAAASANGLCYPEQHQSRQWQPQQCLQQGAASTSAIVPNSISSNVLRVVSAADMLRLEVNQPLQQPVATRPAATGMLQPRQLLPQQQLWPHQPGQVQAATGGCRQQVAVRGHGLQHHVQQQQPLVSRAAAPELHCRRQLQQQAPTSAAKQVAQWLAAQQAQMEQAAYRGNEQQQQQQQPVQQAAYVPDMQRQQTLVTTAVQANSAGHHLHSACQEVAPRGNTLPHPPRQEPFDDGQPAACHAPIAADVQQLPQPQHPAAPAAVQQQGPQLHNTRAVQHMMIVDDDAQCAKRQKVLPCQPWQQQLELQQQQQQQQRSAGPSQPDSHLQQPATETEVLLQQPTTQQAAPAAGAQAKDRGGHSAAVASQPAEAAATAGHAGPFSAPPTPSRLTAHQRVLRCQQSVDIHPDNRLLSSYLGHELVHRYRSIGCMKHDLYDWQAECLHQPCVAAGRNLVFSAPTSAGKSLIALILLLQHLQQQPQQVVLVVMPLVELCSEMSATLEPLLQQLNKEVLRNYGGLHSGPLRHNTGVVVCTIERANVLVTQMLSDDPLLSRLGLVIVDELHMVGDADRGYLLELLLTKIRYTSQAAKLAAQQQQRQQGPPVADVTLSPDTQDRQQRQQHGASPAAGSRLLGSVRHSRQLGRSSSHSSGRSSTLVSSQDGHEAIQVVGMSATLPNVDQIALWLDAQLYSTDFRPVPLHQWIKAGRSVKDREFKLVRELAARDQQLEARDPDHVAQLTQEVVEVGNSVLIFVARREDCAKVATQVTSCISIPERKHTAVTDEQLTQTPTAKTAVSRLTRADVQQRLRELIAGLKLTGDGELHELVRLVGAGAGCHHAGLPREVKELMSKAFSQGVISVLCATTSLAYGVNLPARRVIFKHAYKGYDCPENRLSHTEYMQMSGRAGRAGIDTVGEAILIQDTQGRNEDHLRSLLQGSRVPVRSCLSESGRGMSRALLEVIATGVVASSEDVQQFLDCSLLHFTASNAAADTQAGLRWLYEQHMIRWDVASCQHVATDLGRAVPASGLPPEKAVMVRKDIDTALRHLCVCDAHILYLATPNWNLEAITPNWRKLHDMCVRAVRDGDHRSDTGQVLQFVGLLSSSAMEYIKMQAQRMLTRMRPLAGAELSPEQAAVDTIARRFWGARMLVDIIREIDDETVATTWLPQTSDAARPKVQVVKELRDRAHGFATMVASLCDRLSASDQRYSLIAALLNSHKQRVYHGVREEILALTEIKHVKGPKARIMFEAGIKTAQDVVAAGVDGLLSLFLKLVKPDSITGGLPESRVEREKQVAANIIKAAKQLLASKSVTAAAPAPAGPALTGIAAAATARHINHDSKSVHNSQQVSQLAAGTVPAGGNSVSGALARVDGQVVQQILDSAAVSSQLQQQQQLQQQIAETARQLEEPPAVRQNSKDNSTKSKEDVQQSDMASVPGKQQQQPPPAAALLLSVVPGITVIKDASSMQQLITTLAAADSWAFSLHLDTRDPTLNPAAAKQQAKSSRSKTAAAAAAAAAARKAAQKPAGGYTASDVQIVDGTDDPTITISKAAAGTTRPRQEAPATADNSVDGAWRWAVLGVAFSVSDGSAWYVPLTTGEVAGDISVRVSISNRLKVMWEGLRTIFSSDCSRSSLVDTAAGEIGVNSTSSSVASSCSKVPAVAVAAASSKPGLASAAATDESVWLAPRPVKVTFALKPQLLMLSKPPAGSGLRGIGIQGSVVDVRVAAWLINPDSSKVQESSWTGHQGARYMTQGLQQLLGAPDVFTATEGLQQQQQQCSPELYEACQRATMAHKHYHNIMPHVKSAGLLPLLMGIEMPLVKVLAAMESTGIAINRQVLADQVPAMLKRMEQLAQQAAVYNRGVGFDLVRNGQGTLSRLLFGTKEAGGLQLQPPVGTKRTSSGRYSTAQDVLSEVTDEHPLPGIVLKYRKLSTLHSHLVSRLQHAGPTSGMAGPNAAAGAALMRISGEWMQTCSSSGRLSMGDFSLQCIPRAVEYEIELSPATPGGTRPVRQAQSNIRAGFVAASGCVLLAADYSQIELRLMAHFSGEQALLEALRQGDPFRAMAATWLKKQQNEVTEQDRSKAKQIAYGLIYGMGSGELGRRLGCGELEARAASDDFKSSHPVLMKWIEDVKSACREHSYMRCLSGRRRLLPAITSSSYEARGRAERRAVNGTCQGSAADVVKGVMVELTAQLKARGLQQHCKLLLQIHDELLLEVAQDQLTVSAQLVQYVMESAADVWRLRVPLPVKLSVGPSWGELQPYERQ